MITPSAPLHIRRIRPSGHLRMRVESSRCVKLHETLDGAVQQEQFHTGKLESTASKVAHQGTCTCVLSRCLKLHGTFDGATQQE
eukprot:1140758-Pelagomonas_calceolata.AAC.7